MSAELRRRIDGVTDKRPRSVLDAILAHGQITTDELQGEPYNYRQPPRAAADVKEHGIPLVTFYVRGPDGRRIAAYKLGDLEAEYREGFKGRRSIPRSVKDALLKAHGSSCAICGTPFPRQALQVDHRVPYRIGGDMFGLDPAGYMLIDGSCNRAKSHECEGCPNWTSRDPSVCQTCFWSSPDEYEHIAMLPQRRVTITWDGADQIKAFDELSRTAREQGIDVAELLKQLRER